MPLPPLPANLTPRFRLNYTCGGVAHSIVGHQPLQTIAADAVTRATALANQLKILQYQDAVWSSIDFAEAGSDVFNPAGTINIAGTNWTTAQPPAYRPYYLNFAGRGLSGRKTRIFVFGSGPPTTDINWRITPTEWPAIGTVVAALNANPNWLALIDGSTGVVWKNYSNLGAHDRYVKKIRRTG